MASRPNVMRRDSQGLCHVHLHILESLGIVPAHRHAFEVALTLLFDSCVRIVTCQASTLEEYWMQLPRATMHILPFPCTMFSILSFRFLVIWVSGPCGGRHLFATRFLHTMIATWSRYILHITWKVHIEDVTYYGCHSSLTLHINVDAMLSSRDTCAKQILFRVRQLLISICDWNLDRHLLRLTKDARIDNSSCVD